MNERIRLLWSQAVLNNTKTPMNFQDAADEFARLIVKEAARVAGRDVGHFVLEHFGVNSD